MSDKSETNRIERAILAIHDLGSRDNATAVNIMKKLKQEGFSPEEIKAAIKSYLES